MSEFSLFLITYFFFFQAEDGIRDLVRSRGLGDVYKRQGGGLGATSLGCFINKIFGYKMKKFLSFFLVITFLSGCSTSQPVSYTHLTLPTSDLV